MNFDNHSSEGGRYGSTDDPGAAKFEQNPFGKDDLIMVRRIAILAGLSLTGCGLIAYFQYYMGR